MGGIREERKGLSSSDPALVGEPVLSSVGDGGDGVDLLLLFVCCFMRRRMRGGVFRGLRKERRQMEGRVGVKTDDEAAGRYVLERLNELGTKKMPSSLPCTSTADCLGYVAGKNVHVKKKKKKEQNKKKVKMYKNEKT